MQSLKSYHESLEFIYKLHGSDIELRLEHVSLALQLFENPQDSFDAFHIAGTNGKGSTAAMLHRILSASGYRAGLYTSPHLSSFTERIRIADRVITEAEVVGLVQEIWERTSGADVSLTFFEFVTVMALLYFARQAIDTAVVEVGLGGRLDATNVVHPSVSVITTISIDHESFLGSDISSIAREKAGIIKERIPVVCGALPPQAMDVIESVARGKRSPIYRWERDFSIVCDDTGKLDYYGIHRDLDGIELGLRGMHQWRNAAVAIAATELTQNRLPIEETALLQGLKDVKWPGRLEVFSKCPTIILDGAHNVEGIRTLVSELPAVVGDQKIRLLFGSMNDKDWRMMLRLLCKVSSEVVLTQVPRPQSAWPSALKEALPAQIPAKIVADPVEALSGMVAEAKKSHVPILVAGSLYLIGLVRGHAL